MLNKILKSGLPNSELYSERVVLVNAYNIYTLLNYSFVINITYFKPVIQDTVENRTNKYIANVDLEEDSNIKEKNILKDECKFEE